MKPSAGVGTALSPDRFKGRAKAIAMISERIEDPGLWSTCVVGGPRTGKRSLLRYLASPGAAKHFPSRAQSCRVFFDAQVIGNTGNLLHFWIGVIRALQRNLTNNNLAQLLESKHQKAKAGSLDVYDLEDLFDAFADAGSPVVLCVTDFEVPLRNDNFWPPNDFLHVLRALAQRSPRGMGLVISTPRPITEYWDSRQGSPFYHNLVPVPLGLLDESEVREFVNDAFDEAKLPRNTDAADLVLEATYAHPCLVEFVTALSIRKLRDGSSMADIVNALQETIADPNGIFVTLNREIYGELKPYEKDWLDRLQTSPGTLTAPQKSILRRLGESGLLPVGVQV